jgi:hypothetical protein
LPGKPPPDTLPRMDFLGPAIAGALMVPLLLIGSVPIFI